MRRGTKRFAHHPLARICQAGAVALALLAGLAIALPAVANPLEREADFTEHRRKEIQDWLMWAGVYNGRVNGDFGPGTRRAIGRFQGEVGQPTTGYLTDDQIIKLSSMAQAMRSLYRFETYVDPAGRFEIGIPEALLTQGDALPSAALQRESADELVSLKVYAFPVEDGSELEVLFNAASTSSERRSADYKVLRRDWFVVSGSDGGFNFYTRADRARGLLAIFTFSYPKARASDLDRVTIAIANSFRLWPEPVAKPAKPREELPPMAATAPPASRSAPAEFEEWAERLRAGLKTLPLDGRSQIGRLTSGVQLVDADPDAARKDAAALFAAVRESVFLVMATTKSTRTRTDAPISQGSAVAVTERYLLTNCHVIERGADLIAVLQGDNIIQARLAATDRESDRCILEVVDEPLKPVRGLRRYANLAMGERVYSIGAPSGLELTLGEGIVSGLRSLKERHLVQTSAPISRGSSGGGLFDAYGNLVGITTFLLREAQNLNFAIAAEDFTK